MSLNNDISLLILLTCAANDCFTTTEEKLLDEKITTFPPIECKKNLKTPYVRDNPLHHSMVYVPMITNYGCKRSNS